MTNNVYANSLKNMSDEKLREEQVVVNNRMMQAPNKGLANYYRKLRTVAERELESRLTA